jgi:hypothetical protein
MKKGGMALLLLAVFAAGGGKAWLDHRLRSEFQRAVSPILATQGSLRYGQMSVGLDGAVRIKDLALYLPSGEAHIAALTLPHAYRYLKDLPASGEIAMRDVRLTIAAPANSLALLFQAAGYSDYYLSHIEWTNLLDVRAHLHAHFDTSSEPGEIRVEIKIDSATLGQWQVELQFEQVKQRDVRDWPLRRAELHYQDNGLAPRLSAYLSQRAGLDGKDLRAALAQRLNQDIAGLPFSSASLSALQDFIRDPVRLHLLAVPPTPIPVRIWTRYSPSQWPLVLGLQLSNT